MNNQNLAAAAELLSDPSHAEALRVDMRQAILESMATPKRLQIEGSAVSCYVHSVTEDARIRKFKEHWTIDWLRSLRDGAVLYDVGANIGITTLIAAEDVGRAVRVVAIEPAPTNFASLVKNVALNGLGDRVYPLAIGLGGHTAVTRLNLTTYEPGGAMHSFGDILQMDADRHLRPKGYHYCLCVRLDELVQWEGLPFPTHVKIDVDGGELQVLAGGRQVFRDPRCRAVQIEIVDADAACEQSRQVLDFMASAGFTEKARYPRRQEFPRGMDCQFVR